MRSTVFGRAAALRFARDASLVPNEVTPEHFRALRLHWDDGEIVEMLAVEEQIREAAQTFKNVLEAAASFGGEEVVELT